MRFKTDVEHIAHLVGSGHIGYRDGDWYVTDEYSGGVNNSSGLYYRDATAKKYADIANKHGYTPKQVYDGGVVKRLNRQTGGASNTIPYKRWKTEYIVESGGKMEKLEGKLKKLIREELDRITESGGFNRNSAKKVMRLKGRQLDSWWEAIVGGDSSMQSDQQMRKDIIKSMRDDDLSFGEMGKYVQDMYSGKYDDRY